MSTMNLYCKHIIEKFIFVETSAFSSLISTLSFQNIERKVKVGGKTRTEAIAKTKP